ncbi:hypothetical protein B0I35DRAFT_515843 [Stachybotrys elegans]|uniref:Uncharacterized protein n=1 Tax=Stachybotrys elegans TaxID=80388 RepID=A0A8K0WKY8_9HYPO|nr:hypothetical protein B0I35DRAFT_515843 [Stachybotrys elegans]
MLKAKTTEPHPTPQLNLPRIANHLPRCMYIPTPLPRRPALPLVPGRLHVLDKRQSYTTDSRIGIAVGVILGLFLVALLVFLYTYRGSIKLRRKRRRHRHKSSSSKSSKSSDDAPPPPPPPPPPAE